MLYLEKLKIAYAMCLTVLTYQVLTAEMPVRTRSQTANNNADTQEPVQVPLTREQKMMKKEEDRKRKYCQMKYDMEDRIAARALAEDRQRQVKDQAKQYNATHNYAKTTPSEIKYEYDPRKYKIDKNRPIGSVNKIYDNGINGTKHLMELLHIHNVPLEHLDPDSRDWLYRHL